MVVEDVDKIVCDIIIKVGYGEYFIYWLGYGIG